jgi:hypothetical protein
MAVLLNDGTTVAAALAIPNGRFVALQAGRT